MQARARWLRDMQKARSGYRALGDLHVLWLKAWRWEPDVDGCFQHLVFIPTDLAPSFRHADDGVDHERAIGLLCPVGLVPLDQPSHRVRDGFSTIGRRDKSPAECRLLTFATANVEVDGVMHAGHADAVVCVSEIELAPRLGGGIDQFVPDPPPTRQVGLRTIVTSHDGRADVIEQRLANDRAACCERIVICQLHVNSNLVDGRIQEVPRFYNYSINTYKKQYLAIRHHRKYRDGDLPSLRLVGWFCESQRP